MLLHKFDFKLAIGMSILIWSIFTLLQGDIGFFAAGTAIRSYPFIVGKIERVESEAPTK